MYRYNIHKECIAMLLAGGQGSRLTVLTRNNAKPAVSFGGKYRIIDFPLSNCVNSGIDTVGIMTQYQPMELNEYIGNGSPWGLNRSSGGVQILPPYAGSDKAEWYKGTANAIYQNLGFVDKYTPQYVLILSGDHVYKMDYSALIAFHKQKNALCTIGVIEVPWEDASAFGILTLNKDMSVAEFCEKPQKPKSNIASMGIYVFDTAALRTLLHEDEEDENSSHDFGKDIIPKLISRNEPVYAYMFDGYWKDVGTPQSLWQANMDLLNPTSAIGIRDKDFRIFSRNYALPPAFFDRTCKTDNCIVAEGCTLYGTAEKSIISTGCVIEKNACVKNCVLMPHCIIKEGVRVLNAIIAPSCTVYNSTSDASEDNVTVITEESRCNL